MLCERTLPTIAIVEPQSLVAEATVKICEHAGYTAAAYPRNVLLMQDFMRKHPDIVLLGSEHPRIYESWEYAARFHEMGALIIMFTRHEPALTEIGKTLRGTWFHGGILLPTRRLTVIRTIEKIWHQSLTKRIKIPS